VRPPFAEFLKFSLEWFNSLQAQTFNTRNKFQASWYISSYIHGIFTISGIFSILSFSLIHFDVSASSRYPNLLSNTHSLLGVSRDL
jgi:hypothetical protein